MSPGQTPWSLTVALVEYRLSPTCVQTLVKVYALCHTVQSGKVVERVRDIRPTVAANKLMVDFKGRLNLCLRNARTKALIHKNGEPASVYRFPLTWDVPRQPRW